MDMDGKNVIKFSGEHADWYPIITLDSEWFAFVSSRDGNEEIYAMHVNTNNVMRLTENPAQDTTPAISSDENWVVFASKRQGGGFQLYRKVFQEEQ
jgi:TolB protein